MQPSANLYLDLDDVEPPSEDGLETVHYTPTNYHLQDRSPSDHVSPPVTFLRYGQLEYQSTFRFQVRVIDSI